MLVEFLGQDRTSVALTGTAFGENGEGFGRSGEREVNGTKMQIHGSVVKNNQLQGCALSSRLFSCVIDVCVL